MNTSKPRVLVWGAHPDPSRYANQAAVLLQQKGYALALTGIRAGEIAGVPISPEFPEAHSVHTATVYVNAEHSSKAKAELLRLYPQRVIFNPGAENPELMQELQQAGIQVETACTLVLLHTGQF
jgi:predicted CoA-binding protein